MVAIEDAASTAVIDGASTAPAIMDAEPSEVGERRDSDAAAELERWRERERERADDEEQPSAMTSPREADDDGGVEGSADELSMTKSFGRPLLDAFTAAGDASPGDASHGERYPDVGRDDEWRDDEPTPLANGWFSAFDEATGRLYYYHEDSGAVSWTLPLEADGEYMAQFYNDDGGHCSDQYHSDEAGEYSEQDHNDDGHYSDQHQYDSGRYSEGEGEVEGERDVGYTWQGDDPPADAHADAHAWTQVEHADADELDLHVTDELQQPVVAATPALARAFARMQRFAFEREKQELLGQRAERWRRTRGQLRVGMDALAALVRPNALGKLLDISISYAQRAAWRVLRSRCTARAGRPQLVSWRDVIRRRAMRIWYRRVVDPSRQMAEMRCEQRAMLLWQQRRRRILSLAFPALVCATARQAIASNKVLRVESLTKRVWLRRWVRRRVALQGLWLLDDAARSWSAAVRRVYFSWWRAEVGWRTSHEAIDDARALLSLCWRRLTRRVASSRHFDSLVIRARAKHRRFDFRRGWRGWRAHTTAVRTLRRLWGLAHTTWESRGVVRRVVWGLVRWRASLAARRRKLLHAEKAIQCVRFLSLRRWVREYREARHRPRASRASFRVTLLRDGWSGWRSWHQYSEERRRLRLLSSVYSVRLTRKRGMRWWREAVAPLPPRTAFGYKWVPPLPKAHDASPEAVPWVPSGGTSSQHHAPLTAKPSAAAEGTGALGLFNRGATSASARPRPVRTAAPLPVRAATPLPIDGLPLRLPAPGTSAYRGGRLGRGPLSAEVAAAVAASARYADDGQGNANMATASVETSGLSRAERIAHRSWAPSYEQIERTTANLPSSAGRWKAVPLAKPLGGAPPAPATARAAPIGAPANAPARAVNARGGRRAVPRAVPLRPQAGEERRPQQEQEQQWDGRSLPQSINLFKGRRGGPQQGWRQS